MGKPQEYEVLLAVSPTSRGIGFSVFETQTTLLDWAVKQARINKTTVCERHVESLIEFYLPQTLVLERIENQPSRRRVRNLNRNLAALAEMKNVHVAWYDHEEIQGVFSQFGPATKFGIARTISEWLPELRAQTPSYRKLWMTEDYSMTIFQAIALALTHYYLSD